MARYGNVFAGPVEKTRPLSAERVMAADTAPGTLVIVDGSDEFAVLTAQGTRPAFFILSEGTITQDDTDVDIPAGGTGIGFYPQEGCFFHVLVADSVSCVEETTLLTVSTAGVLEVAASGDEVLFVAAETFNNTTGSAQLVTVRPYSGSVA